ncbi:MAG: NUDIX domain-containing protein [Bifidobacteriaceae bacterium]|jgi:ADP-ribose pyrophosphatase YjhB (NUDIX family)|nr:NUDIX domain-containing protein [Bifidobacteriaceae bacterium]MCI1914197.1 NUDIX domain-containing protein [Bifidobacteriaceae bacterium]
MTTPTFILKLRQKIGHDPLWLIGVTAFVRDAAGRVLLARRADTGEWALIYGINEPAEEPADTVIREVKEETGVDCVPELLASVKSSARMLTYANGDQAQYMDHTFICSLAPGGNATPGTGDGENTESGWFKLDALPSPLAASTVERLATVKKFLARPDKTALFSSELLG